MFQQEIIKVHVRDWMPHIGLMPKVIPLKIFLDVVPGYSDVTRAIRGQPKQTFSKPTFICFLFIILLNFIYTRVKHQDLK